jgi:hypothetical protein
MRLVRNPSYKHPPELIREFNKHKDSISFKDHTQYTYELLNLILNVVIECKRLGLSNKHILWLTKQIHENQLTEDRVKEDYLPLIKFHFNNQDLLKHINSYSSISELNTEIESLGEENETVSDKELDIFFEKDGWLLAMPHTTKASCLLGKDTEWCTARTKSQNLFLNYVGGCFNNIILFYVIKIDGNPKKNPNDKLSVGFMNGKPVFNQKDASLTVNALNYGISIKEFKQILGKDLAKTMLIKMDEKSQSIKGKHPAKGEMERIAKSVDRYMKKISEFKNEDELNDFRKEIAKYNLSKDMQIILSEDKDEVIIMHLAENPNLIESIQLKLADNKHEGVRVVLAQNPNLIESVQIKLTKQNELIIESLSKNPNLFESVQLKLANNEKEYVRRYLAQNPNLFESVQLKLADDEDEEVRMYLAGNPNLIKSLQNKFADDKDEGVRVNLAGNTNLTESLQIKLTDDKDEWVRISLLKHKNLIKSIQLKLAGDEDEVVRRYLALYPNLIESVKLKLADDEDEEVRSNLAAYHNIFKSTKMKLKK